jgi:hypothetical protein
MPFFIMTPLYALILRSPGGYFNPFVWSVAIPGRDAYNLVGGVQAMRQLTIILGMFCLCGAPGFGGEKTFSLFVCGGLTGINPLELNDFLRDSARHYVRYDAGDAGLDMTSRELRTSYDFEFTLFVRIAPRVFLTFGSGFIKADLESDPLVKSLGDLEISLFRNDKIHSIPARVGLLYSWPLARRLSLRPHVALDGYISSFEDKGNEKWNYLDEGYISQYPLEVKTHAFSWGSTAGVTLDLALSDRVSLSVDAGFRRARLTGFHEADKSSAGGEFRLLYYEFYSEWTKSWYKFLNLPFSAGSPSFDIIRDAVLDLSGPYLRVGLRLTL